MEHTLARLVYRMLKFGHQYVDRGIEYYEAKYRQHQLRWTAKQAAALNMQLVPIPELGG
jgi:transposase